MGCRLSCGTNGVFLETMEMPWECSQNPWCLSFMVSVTFSMAVTSVQRSGSLHGCSVPFYKGRIPFSFPCLCCFILSTSHGFLPQKISVCCSALLCLRPRGSRAAWSEYQAMFLSAPRMHHICGLKTCSFLSGKEQPPLLKIKHVTWPLILCQIWESNVSVAARWLNWSPPSPPFFPLGGRYCLQSLR